jgi:hypothetical protein
VRKNFDFRWKLVENYGAAAFCLIFLWMFVKGMVENDQTILVSSLLLLCIGPFLITFLDKKSSGN